MFMEGYMEKFIKKIKYFGLKITSYSCLAKIFNYIFCFILYVFFVGLFSYIVSNNLSLSIDYAIYKDKYILSFVQLSNLIFWLWMLITFFIKIYNYFRKKFD